MNFLNIDRKDIEAYVKGLPDDCLLRELRVSEQAIDSYIFDNSLMLDMFIYLIDVIQEECVVRLAKRLEEETAAQNP